MAFHFHAFFISLAAYSITGYTVIIGFIDFSVWSFHDFFMV
jgi:hypothetical protein